MRLYDKDLIKMFVFALFVLSCLQISAIEFKKYLP